MAALMLGIAAAPAAAAGTGLEAYDVPVDAQKLEQLAQQGFDMTEGRRGNKVEIVATPQQASTLRKLGLKPALKKATGSASRSRPRARRSAQRPDGSYDVYRPYFDDTYVGKDAQGAERATLYEEYRRLARENPGLVKVVEIGRSVNGKPIIALKLTKDARTTTDGQRPATLYSAAQHAREWITPEMNRRLFRYVLDQYKAGVPKIREVLARNELWVVPVANPDGYDFTFTPGNRLWRKNLREINGQPGIQNGDGVDPNRNFPTKWKYDDEGSSGDPASETYRGSGPASEPETQAMDGLLKRIGFRFQVNYHSAAQLLLYPYGFQVETATADDPIYRALSGTDADSAIKGNGPGAPNVYDPDLGAELYTTNGETTDHAHGAYGTLAWTPEMDVSDPARGGGASVFEFQDSEADVQAAFEKNIPFALDVAASTDDPANPESHLGNEPAPFEIEPFEDSYGTPQTVQVNAKRELGRVELHYRIDGGDEQTTPTIEFKGGERYGKGYDVYYHRLRGAVRGAAVGANVRVWFEGGGKRSGSFTYTVRATSGNPVLLLGAEDYSGRSPDYADKAKPAYQAFYEDALRRAGVGFDVYDVDARGRRAPDPLGVLSHYKAVVWYTGDDQRTIEPDQPPTGAGASTLADDEFRAVRDYLNEGGKLLYTGERAGFNLANQYVFNAQGDPPYCNDPAAPAGACIPLSNDFLQYYLGAYQNNVYATSKEQLTGNGVTFGAAPFAPLSLSLNGGDSADNQSAAYSLTPTSSILPAAEYPQFRSEAVASYGRPGPLSPAAGSFYAYSGQANNSYNRLSRTVDLTGKTSGALKFKTSFDAEVDYDYLFVEAHTVGQDDWTTLPDRNGNTSDAPGSSCTDGWSQPDGSHPFLAHYQTRTGATTCTSSGTTGTWNAATGNSQGYQDWDVDLSAFTGKQVEVSITYATDPAVQNLGVFVDETQVLVDGAGVAQDGFEAGLGGWSTPAPPESSEGSNGWIRSDAIFEEAAGVGTEDSLYYGFGLEGVSGAAERGTLMRRSLQYLGVLPRGEGGGIPGGTPGGGGGVPGGGSGVPGGGSGGVASGGGSGNPAGSGVRATISARAVRLTRRGTAPIRIACPRSARTRCRVTLRLLASTRTLGRASVTLAPGRSRTVQVKLSKSARRLLTRRKRLRVQIIAGTTDASGVRRGSTRRITIRPAKRPARARR